MKNRVGYIGIILMSVLCLSLNCFEKKTTSPESGRPEEPSNPLPADGASEQPSNVTLSWSCNDPDGDPITYAIYFGTLAIPPLVSEHHFSTEYQVSNLLQSKTYYWRVVAEDDQGNRGNGEVWSFSTVEGDDDGGDDDEWGEAELLFSGMYDPSITADGRTMYMTGNDDIYVSNKSGDVWSNPVALPYPVNDTSEYNFEFSPSITGDGSTLYFIRFLDYDAFWYSRKLGNTWGEPQRVSIGFPDLYLSYELSISWDGTILWFAAVIPPSQNKDIYYITYNGSTWSDPQPFTAVNTPEYNETGMAISADGSSFYFTSRGRNGDSNSREIWVTHKVYGAWQTPEPLGETINIPDCNRSSAPAISYDGSSLYFNASCGYPWPSGIYVANALR